MVEDPNLAIHLSHWGINMMNMEKTDLSMADLEIEINQKYGEASMIEEANSKLQPVHGAGKFIIRQGVLIVIEIETKQNHYFLIIGIRKTLDFENCIPKRDCI